MIVEMFAIRKKGTNHYMPARSNGRGYTYDEPIAHGGVLGPRLFHTQHAAKVALAAWAKGHYERVATYCPETGYCDGDEIQVHPVAHRNVADMEVVRVSIREEPAA